MSSTSELTARSKRVILYALGSNGNGQLGLNHKDDINSPEPCSFRSSIGKSAAEYMPINDDETVNKIVVGGNHSLLLTSKGRLWTTGSNLEGQRGISTSIVSTDSGDDLGWHEYQLGDHVEPDSVSIDLRITDIAATFSASFLVIAGQQIYSFGSGAKGELGLGEDILSSPTPRLCFNLRDVEAVSGKSNIIGISACMSHVVVLSSSRAIYGWGASRKGQLGESAKTNKSLWKPQMLEFGPHMKGVPSRIMTGRDFTFVELHESNRKSHLFLGDAAKLGITIPLSTCVNFNVSVSTGQPSEKAILHELDLERLQDLQAGWTTLTTLTKSGTVQTLGSNRRSVVSAPLHNIRSIAAGSEHCVAITNQGSITAWGWGEHGNCGRDLDESKNVRDGFNVIFEPSRMQEVVGIAAGCATTFFWTTDMSL